MHSEQTAVSGAHSGEGLVIISNSGSGQAVIRADPMPLVARRLPAARVRTMHPGESLDDVVAEEMRSDPAPEVLGILGGDGSVSRMAHLARVHERPLLVLPNGTFNHFARAAGIDSVDTGITAYLDGRVRSIAVAEATADDGEPVTVLNAVSLGAYPQFLAERERRDGGKWFGGLAAIVKALRGARPVRIGRDGRHATVWSVFVSVGRNAPDRHATMQRARLADPLLDIRVHHARGTRLRAIASLAFGRRTAAVLRALRVMPPASEFERLVESDVTLEVAPGTAPSVFVHDGELESQNPAGFRLRIRAVPDALRVYAP